jgi:hypothetical protein
MIGVTRAAAALALTLMLVGTARAGGDPAQRRSALPGLRRLPQVRSRQQ